MKKADIKIGEIYYANISGKKTHVRIDAEVSSGGWSATNVETGKSMRIKSAQRLSGVVRAKGSAQTTTDGNLTVVEVPPTEVVSIGSTTKTTKSTKPIRGGDSPKKLSAINAAVLVLRESNEPLNAKQLVEAMTTKGYWTSPGGKTPHATLFSAIQREIDKKGAESRFAKAERGKFSLTGAGADQ